VTKKIKNEFDAIPKTGETKTRSKYLRWKKKNNKAPSSSSSQAIFHLKNV